MSISTNSSLLSLWSDTEVSLNLESESEGSESTEPFLLPFARPPVTPPASPPSSSAATDGAEPSLLPLARLFKKLPARTSAHPAATDRPVAQTQSESLLRQLFKTPKHGARTDAVDPDLTATPVVIKQHSNKHLGEGRPSRRKMIVPQIKGSLQRELKGAIELRVEGLVDSVLGGQLFDWDYMLAQMTKAGTPDSVNDISYNSTTRNWNNWPPTNQRGTEALLVVHLNKVADVVRLVLAKPRTEDDLIFSSRFNVAGPNTHSTYSRKPDFIVIPRSLEHTNEVSWPDLRVVGSLKVGTQSQRKEYQQLMEYARLCFSQQRDRRFVLGMGFRHTTLTLYVFDRSGILASREYNVHQDPKQFLRVVFGILFTDRAKLGYDTSFFEETNEGKKACYLEVGRRRYKIEEDLYLDLSIRGRGTVCLKVKRMDGLAKHKGRVCVVKDAWVDRSRPMKEVDMLKYLKACKIKNVSHLIAHEIVQVTIDETGRRVADSTSIFRDPSMGMELRDHHRIVMWPCGAPIWTFTSLVELASALLDVVETIEALDDKDVLHRDISIDNLVLVPTKNSAVRKGYIIDFDYAIKNSKQKRETPKGKRTGTLPFMAIDILKYNANHIAIHDAESVLYVLIWITFLYAGPNGLWRKMTPAFYDKSILRKWSPFVVEDEANLETVANEKSYMMKEEDEFYEVILLKRDPYFSPLDSCLSSMRRALFPPKPAPSASVIRDDKFRNTMDHRRKEDVFKGVKKALKDAVASLSSESATAPLSSSKDADGSASDSSNDSVEEPQFAADLVLATKYRHLVKDPEEASDFDSESETGEDENEPCDPKLNEPQTVIVRSAAKRSRSMVEEEEETPGTEVILAAPRSKRSRTLRTQDKDDSTSLQPSSSSE